MKKYTGILTVILTAALLAGCGENNHLTEILEDLTTQEADLGEERKTEEEKEPENRREETESRRGAGERSDRDADPGERRASEDAKTATTAAMETQTPAETQEVTTAAPQEEGGFTFADTEGWEFYFSSGAGAWYTALNIHSDGTFDGHYQDADMGDIGDGYPNGTLYYCDFYGRFTEPVKVNNMTYAFRIADISYPYGSGEQIIDGTRYIYTSAYGLDGAENLYIYLPGSPTAALPGDFAGWVMFDIQGKDYLDFYGLYNEAQGEGFSSYQYQEYMSVYERASAVASSAELQAADLEIQLQNAGSQAEMNSVSGQIYQVWDDALNEIWSIFKENLNPDIMEELTQEERAWIKEKEAQAQAAGAEYEGGSMQSMVVSLKAAELTKSRVYELVNYANFE